MAEITDEYMRAMLPTTKEYTAVLLKAGPNRRMEGVDKIVWEHGRRNFSLRADGVLSIVCPVPGGEELERHRHLQRDGRGDHGRSWTATPACRPASSSTSSTRAGASRATRYRPDVCTETA